MKNNANRLVFLSAILLLACSFTNQPVSVEVSQNSGDAVGEVPYGGAYIFFAGKYGGEITKQEMAGQTEVKVEGCARGSRIFNFTLSITKGGNTSTFTTNSNMLTDEMRNKLNSLSKGDAFEFRQAKACMPNGKDVVDVRGSKFIVV